MMNLPRVWKPAMILVMAGAVIGHPGPATAQTQSTVEPPRTADPSFRPEFDSPAFPVGKGPTVCVDEAHHNFHTRDGTYWGFAEVLRADGYVVERETERFRNGGGAGCDILVIADAQPPMAVDDPPTFSQVEVEAIHRWVTRGGRLFLITDHAPDPESIRALAGSFGFEVNDGYVLNGAPEGPERPLRFRRADGTLADDPIIVGGAGQPTIEVVATFTGSAFRLTADSVGWGGGENRETEDGTLRPFRPLLVFGPERRSWMPEEYWTFTDDTPTVDVEGWFQGGIREVGEGRVAFFSEAAMFTAQVFDQGRVRAGMNAPEAEGNLSLLRRVMFWLAS